MLIIIGLSLFFLINLPLANEDYRYLSVEKVDEINEYSVAIQYASHFFIDDINTLEELSPLIVRAKYIGERALKEWIDIPTGQVVAKGSESKVNITKIVKGEINNNSSTISIYEPAYFVEDMFISIEGYNLVNEEGDYLLFLRPMSNEEAYAIVGMYQGKYNLNTPELSESVESIKTYADESIS